MASTLVVSANGTHARMYLQAAGCPTLDEVHDVTGDRLAHTVAAYLRQTHEADAFQRLVLVGSPEFLGAMRELLPESLAAAVAARIEGDCTRMSPEQLFERVGPALQAPH